MTIICSPEVLPLQMCFQMLSCLSDSGETFNPQSASQADLELNCELFCSTLPPTIKSQQTVKEQRHIGMVQLYILTLQEPRFPMFKFLNFILFKISDICPNLYISDPHTMPEPLPHSKLSWTFPICVQNRALGAQSRPLVAQSRALRTQNSVLSGERRHLRCFRWLRAPK